MTECWEIEKSLVVRDWMVNLKTNNETPWAKYSFFSRTACVLPNKRMKSLWNNEEKIRAWSQSRSNETLFQIICRPLRLHVCVAGVFKKWIFYIEIWKPKKKIQIQIRNKTIIENLSSPLIYWRVKVFDSLSLFLHTSCLLCLSNETHNAYATDHWICQWLARFFICIKYFMNDGDDDHEVTKHDISTFYRFWIFV